MKHASLLMSALALLLSLIALATSRSATPMSLDERQERLAEAIKMLADDTEAVRKNFEARLEVAKRTQSSLEMSAKNHDMRLKRLEGVPTE